MERLTYNELKTRVGEKVLVVDYADKNIRVPEPQYCTVTKNNKICKECGHEYFVISLENVDYSFDYDVNGNCLDGDFEAYELEKCDKEQTEQGSSDKLILDKLIQMYISETISDQQMFCGCRPDDCNLWNTEKCRKCVIELVINGMKGQN